MICKEDGWNQISSLFLALSGSALRRGFGEGGDPDGGRHELGAERWNRIPEQDHAFQVRPPLRRKPQGMETFRRSAGERGLRIGDLDAGFPSSVRPDWSGRGGWTLGRCSDSGTRFVPDTPPPLPTKSPYFCLRNLFIHSFRRRQGAISTRVSPPRGISRR